jgi:hypothetical protein
MRPAKRSVRPAAFGYQNNNVVHSFLLSCALGLQKVCYDCKKLRYFWLYKFCPLIHVFTNFICCRPTVGYDKVRWTDSRLDLIRQTIGIFAYINSLKPKLV